jgi:hypothetical protein
VTQVAIPSVSINVSDGNLGVVASGSKVQAVLGIASKGPVNAPASFGSVRDLTAAFGTGPAVEAAALVIQQGAQALFVKVAQSADGSAGTVADLGDGTSAITVSSTGEKPADDLDVVVEWLADGTVGTAGAKYRLSLDGGNNFGPPTALGTANTVVVPGVATFALGAGTIKNGDVTKVRVTAPTYGTTELSAALDALAGSSARYRTLHVVGASNAAVCAAIEGKLATMATKVKPRRAIVSARLPNAGESDAAYVTALQPLSDAFASGRVSIAAGAVSQISAVTGRVQRRPLAFAYAARQASVDTEIDVADVNLGSLTGCSIKDVNGNPIADYHDENVNAGLDDLRFVAARTWETVAGTYITRPRTSAAPGSDFRLLPHGLVVDEAHEIAYGALLRRLNRPVNIDKKTGRISEIDAKDIEAVVTAQLEAALMAAPKASAISVTVDRMASVLQTGEVHVTIRVVPIGYIEQFSVDLGLAAKIA